MDIIQYNIRGLENNRNDIDTLHHLYKPSLFCLQETHIKNNIIPTIRNYKIIYNQNNTATQGVAFLIKDNLKYLQIQLNTDIQAIAISINIPFKVNICNIYMHPQMKISDTELQNLIDQIPQPRLILGDFNAHNPLWGSASQNPRGRTIENIITHNNLICINNDDFTYYHPSSGTATKIDLAISSLSIAPKITWRVLEQLQSDHVPIILSTMPTANNQNNVLSQTINYNSINWEHFEQHLKPIPHSNVTMDRIATLTLNIVEALKAAQKTTKNNSKRCIPWWTPKLSILRNAKNKAFKTFHRYPTDINREIFNKTKREFRNEN